MENYTITVARGFGSGGKEIASRVAKDLGIHCYENRILTLASQMSGIDRQLLKKSTKGFTARKKDFLHFFQVFRAVKTPNPNTESLFLMTSFLNMKNRLSWNFQKQKAA